MFMNIVKWFVWIVVILGVLMFALAVGISWHSASAYCDTNEVEVIAPDWYPTPDSPEGMAIEEEISNLTVIVVSGEFPEIPLVTLADTNPPPPRMTVDIFPDYIVAELNADTRQAIDMERRPKVRFQKRITLTNDWEDVVVLEPWRMAEFYRVIIE